MKNLKKGLFAVLLVTVMALGSVLAYADPTQEELDRLRDRETELQGTRDDTQNLLDDTRHEMAGVIAEIERMDAELEEAIVRLNKTTSDLMDTRQLLEQARADLVAATYRRETQYDALRARIRIMYESGSVGYMDVLFESTSLSDMMNRFVYISRIIAFDNDLFDSMIRIENSIRETIAMIQDKEQQQQQLELRQITEANDLTAAIEERNLRVAQLGLDVTAFSAAIDNIVAEAENVRHLIAETEARLEAERIARIEAENRRRMAEEAARAAAREAEIQRDRDRLAHTQPAARAPAASAPANPYAEGAVFRWPVSGHYGVSSGFGNRYSPITGNREFHQGIDIPAPQGTNVIAADSGTVIVSRNWGSYGNTVMIDHDNNVQTLYAHNSELLVSVGDWVERGHVIARIGSTGASTGPHLHFEVRIGGQQVSPWPFLGRG